MKTFFWFLGKSLEFSGILLVPIGLFIGIGEGNLGLEYLIGGLGIGLFFIGQTLIRAVAGKE